MEWCVTIKCGNCGYYKYKYVDGLDGAFALIKDQINWAGHVESQVEFTIEPCTSFDYDRNESMACRWEKYYSK
jgi:hypothetical protein